MFVLQELCYVSAPRLGNLKLCMRSLCIVPRLEAVMCPECAQFMYVLPVCVLCIVLPVYVCAPRMCPVSSLVIPECPEAV
jgi:hypothetical protein